MVTWPVKRSVRQIETDSSASAHQSQANVARSDDMFMSWEGDSRLDYEQHIPRHVRALSKVTLDFTLNSTYTNTSFADDFCSQLNGTDAWRVYIRGIDTAYYQLPSCIAEFAPNLVAFDGYRVIVQDFSHFPASVRALSLTSSVFVPSFLGTSTPPTSSTPTSSSTPSTSSTDPNDGYDPAGNISWQEIWETLPLLAVVNWLDGDLRGSLPSALPSHASYFYMPNHGLSGSIPDTLFSQLGDRANLSLVFRVNGNQLSGSLPAALFSGFTTSNFSNLLVDFSSNSLSGSLPSGILSAFTDANCGKVRMSLRSNGLTGALPADLFPAGFVSKGSSFSFDISRNNLTGAFPATLFQNMKDMNNFYFNASANGLTGNLPASIFSSVWTPSYSPYLTFSLANNKISGSLPASFLTGSFGANVTFGKATIDLHNNQIQGSIPQNLLYSITQAKRTNEKLEGGSKTLGDGGITTLETTTTGSYYESYANDVVTCISASSELTIRLDSNQLSGSVPAGLLSYAFGPQSLAMSLTLNVSNNALIGQLSDNVFTNVPSTFGKLQVLAASNKLSGSPPAFCSANSPLYIDLSNNVLDGTIPATWQSCFIPYVSLASNHKLAGSIPAALLSDTKIAYFNASYTSLAGTFPATVGSTLSSIDLTYTYVDFCTGHSSPSSSPLDGFVGTCNLLRTDANNCQSTYSMCTTSALGCSLKTRPSVDFDCINGVWTATNVVTAPIIIQPGTGTVIIAANVTTKSVTFNGLGSNITIVDGCITNLSSIYVELEESELDQIGKAKLLQQLLSLSNSTIACSNLDGIAVTSGVKNGGCKKVKVEKVTSSDSNTLGGLFTLDTSGCNLWWIILVSVICAVVALGVIAAIVGIVLYRRHKSSERKDRLRTHTRHAVQ